MVNSRNLLESESFPKAFKRQITVNFLVIAPLTCHATEVVVGITKALQ